MTDVMVVRVGSKLLTRLAKDHPEGARVTLKTHSAADRKYVSDLVESLRKSKFCVDLQWTTKDSATIHAKVATPE